jgi:acyl-homoserine lactone acylase PvdQ
MDLQPLFSLISISLNYIFADKMGNIGYQQTGAFPKRRKDVSGLFPLPVRKKKLKKKKFIKKI